MAALQQNDFWHTCITACQHARGLTNKTRRARLTWVTVCTKRCDFGEALRSHSADLTTEKGRSENDVCVTCVVDDAWLESKCKPSTSPFRPVCVLARLAPNSFHNNHAARPYITAGQNRSPSCFSPTKKLSGRAEEPRHAISWDVINSRTGGHVIARPLSNVEYTSVACSTVDIGLTKLIHDRCSCTLLHSRLFTLGWMCPLKREQARRERESELRLVNSL